MGEGKGGRSPPTGSVDGEDGVEHTHALGVEGDQVLALHIPRHDGRAGALKVGSCDLLLEGRANAVGHGQGGHGGVEGHKARHPLPVQLGEGDGADGVGEFADQGQTVGGDG
ncbi:hypothetical protein EBZ39_17405 [bacterium]|nr:hypothetical protein [bacterium]